MLAALILLAAAPAEAQRGWQTETRDLQIPMRDGKWLAADVYLPSKPGRYPAVLIQTPYDKQRAEVLFGVTGGEPARGSWQEAFDRERYAYVVVDWRGFNGSRAAGKPTSGRKRSEDGFDTVEWVATQSFCNGKVGTWGPSALGVQQFATMLGEPPHLVCASPVSASMGGSYEQFYPGGVLLESHLDSLARLGFGTTGLARAFPSPDARAWKEAERATRRPQLVQVPVLLMTGWWDNYPDLILRTYHDLRRRGGRKSRRETRILIGPWDHLSIGQSEVGVFQFPEAVAAPYAWTRKFFDAWLSESPDSGWEALPRVQYWPIHGDHWVAAEDWPPQTETRIWNLHMDGSISTEDLETAEQAESHLRGYEHDPLEPAPTLGGGNLPPLRRGPTDHSTLARRPDVLVYSTGPLDEPLSLAGTIELFLSFAVDRVDCDFAVRLCSQAPGGPPVLITEGIQRARFREPGAVKLLIPEQPAELTVRLQSVAVDFPEDYALVLFLSSANWPRYERNPHTGEDHFKEESAEPLRVRIYHHRDRPSYLSLPVVSGGEK